jgi:hypothetical protein
MTLMKQVERHLQSMCVLNKIEAGGNIYKKCFPFILL